MQGDATDNNIPNPASPPPEQNSTLPSTGLSGGISEEIFDNSSSLYPTAGPSSTIRTFVGGRLIVTTLSVLFLVLGLGAGTLLVLQPQLLEQKASTISYLPSPAPSNLVINSNDLNPFATSCDEKCSFFSDNKRTGKCISVGFDPQATDAMYRTAVDGVCLLKFGATCSYKLKSLTKECGNINKETTRCRCLLTPK